MVQLSSPSSNLFLQLKCCGVENVKDWRKNPKIEKFHFKASINKPEGCCKIDRTDAELNAGEIEVEYHREHQTFLINFLFVTF